MFNTRTQRTHAYTAWKLSTDWDIVHPELNLQMKDRKKKELRIENAPTHKFETYKIRHSLVTLIVATRSVYSSSVSTIGETVSRTN